jgi:hypothetical protein
MTDGKPGLVKETAEAVATIIKEVSVYPDAIQPAARELGTLVATPFSLLNTALRPVRLILQGINLVYDNLEDSLRRHLANVPPEQVVEPPANVAGPLLLAYPFVESEPDLRELFARLLATAMTSAIQRSAHPSFVEVIKQLTVDEAKLVRSFAERSWLQYPVVEVRVFGGSAYPGFQVRGLLFDFGDVPLSAPLRLPAYVHNLQRLGLVTISFAERVADDAPYVKFETMPEIVRLRENAAAVAQGGSVQAAPGVVKVTPYGALFLAACVNPSFKWAASMGP